VKGEVNEKRRMHSTTYGMAIHCRCASPRAGMKVALLVDGVWAGRLLCEEAEGVPADMASLHRSRSRPFFSRRTSGFGEGVV
jgi:hypothetical protein